MSLNGVKMILIEKNNFLFKYVKCMCIVWTYKYVDICDIKI